MSLNKTTPEREKIKDALNKFQSSFPRRREPSQINKLDTRLRGYDNLIQRFLKRNRRNKGAHYTFAQPAVAPFLPIAHNRGRL
jgi:hypothetical protein